MARIAFINPWNIDEEGVHYSHEYHETYWRNAYYGIVQLATYIRDAGHEVLILDGQRDLLLEAEGDPDLLLVRMRDTLVDWQPDVVGVTGMSCLYSAAYRILRMAAELLPRLGFKLIMGGHHASAVPEECLKDHPEIDCVLIGAGEISLEKYLSGTQKMEIRGICYSENGRAIRTRTAERAPFDKLPMPDWDLLDVEFYTRSCIWLHRSLSPLRNLDSIVSFGCNNHCGFCNPSSIGGGSTVDYRPIGQVIEYLKLIRDKYGANATMFQDSSLASSPEYLAELCETMLSENIHKTMTWNANVRADQIDEPLARLMIRAGCKMVFIGFESGSNRMLRRMRKGTTVQINRNCAAALERAGMPYWASFIVGYPGERVDELEASFEFAKELDCLAGWPNEFNPASGSAIFNELLRQGQLVLPTSPEEWLSISRIGQSGKVADGGWSAMDAETFHGIVRPFKRMMQNRLDKNVQRRILG